MKKIIILLATVLFSTPLFSQGLTQSAKGESTVFLSGSAVSFNPRDADLSFGINNLNKIVAVKNNFTFFSGDINVKNKGGIGNLFSKGKFVPQTNIQGYVGFVFSNALDQRKAANEENVTTLNVRLREEFRSSLLASIDDNDGLVIDAEERAQAAAAIAKEYEDYINAGNPAVRFAKDLKEDDANAEKAALRKAVKKELKLVAQKIKAQPEAAEMTAEALYEYNEHKKSKGYKVIIFGFGGMDAMSFLRFVNVDSADFSNSFKNEYFKGGRVGAGLNASYRRMTIGITYAYSKTNNYSSLAEAEYTINENHVIDGNTFSSEEKVTAYSGNYGIIELNELNVDFIYNFKLEEKSKTHILLNPYLRANVASRDKSLLTNTMNIGLGAYSYKASGALMGGLYVELPDINNNLEKRKPIANQNLQTPLKRLTFGIVAKISLKSLMNI